MVVAGQPLDINEDDCMLFTFTDLNPGAPGNRRCGKEERFAKAFRLEPGADVVVYGARAARADVNEAFTRTTEYDAEALIGKTIDEIPFIDDPEANRRLFAALEKAATSKGWTSGCARKGASRSTACGLGGCRQHPQCALLPAVLMDITNANARAGAGQRHRRSDAGRLLFSQTPIENWPT
ncbi:PAS domain-containing protein [Serratia ureilytica]